MHRRAPHVQSETTSCKNIIFSLHSRCVLTYGSSQTGLCNKVRPKVRSVQYSKLYTKANSEFHLRMKQLEPGVPYLWQYFVAKSSLGRSIRKYAPWVWRKDFGSHRWCFAVYIDSKRVSLVDQCCVFRKPEYWLNFLNQSCSRKCSRLLSHEHPLRYKKL